MIELDSISVHRGSACLLAGVTLAFEPGITALVGPSGSGKTTLLRVILGLEMPSSGRVSIDGRIVSSAGRAVVPVEERQVAMVFQDLALWPHLSVRGNLEYGLRARGIGKAERERRIARALAWVALEAEGARPPQELSGGERQRVAIARALVLDPVALLLDEPLGSLDVALKDELLGLFERLFRERAIPIVHVTHDPREAARLAQQLVVLEGGRVTQQGSWNDIAQNSATPFVTAFARAARVAHSTWWSEPQCRETPP